MEIRRGPTWKNKIKTGEIHHVKRTLHFSAFSGTLIDHLDFGWVMAGQENERIFFCLTMEILVCHDKILL